MSVLKHILQIFQNCEKSIIIIILTLFIYNLPSQYTSTHLFAGDMNNSYPQSESPAGEDNKCKLVHCIKILR